MDFFKTQTKYKLYDMTNIWPKFKKDTQILSCKRTTSIYALFCRSWFPYDVYASPIFEITLTIYATILMASVIGAISATHVMFMATLVQTIGQYKILRFNLSNIRTLAEKAVTRKVFLKKKQRMVNIMKNISKELNSEPQETLVENLRSGLHQQYEDATLVTLSTQAINLDNESDLEKRNELQISVSSCSDISKSNVLKHPESRSTIIHIEPLLPTAERRYSSKHVGINSLNVNDVNREMELCLQLCIQHHQELLG